jgi:hypothetical protein
MSNPKARGNAGWRKINFVGSQLAEVGEMLRETGVIAGDGDPVEASGHRDRAGKIRRMHARYANGWRATLSFRKDGTYSVSQALKLVSTKAELTAGEVPA